MDDNDDHEIVQPTPRRIVAGLGDPREPRLKAVIVGDPHVGKSTLIMSLGLWWSPHSSEYYGRVRVDDQVVNLSVFDTAAQTQFDRLRPLEYPGTDVFLLCYSVDDRQSLQNAQSKWLSEVHFHCSQTRRVLAACKVDLRDDWSGPTACTSTDEGANAARYVGALAFVECSAQSGVGVDDVLDQLVRVALTAHSAGKAQRLKSCDLN